MDTCLHPEDLLDLIETEETYAETANTKRRKINTLEEEDRVDCIEDDMKQESVGAINRKEPFEDEKIFAEVINGNFDSLKNPDNIGCTDFMIISFPSSSGKAKPEEPFVAELILGNVNDSSRGNALENNGCANLNIPATSLSSDSNNLLYKCSQCPYSTTSHDSYVSHEAFYACPLTHTQCKASFLCKSQFEQHLTSAHPNVVHISTDSVDNSLDVTHSDIRPYQCSNCEASFKLKEKLEEHMLRKHSDYRPYQCIVCEARFKVKGDLSKHLRARHSEILPYQCNDCDAKFKMKGELDKHMRTKHSDILTYQCSNCDNRFKLKGNLNQHMRTKHSGICTYQCRDCDATFKVKDELTYHMLTSHSDIRPFECSDCDARFKFNWRLTRHLHSVHNADIRKYQCSDCEARFQSNLWTLERG